MTQRRLPVFVLYLTPIVAIAAAYTSLNAQTPSKSVDSPTFSVSIAMKQPEIPLGQSTWLMVSVKILVENAHYSDAFLPHVEGKEGEAPRTMYHRQLRHEPGLPTLRPDCMSCFPREVKAGDTDIRGLDLTKYYDLSAPGKYSVCVEYPDEKGNSQRTNTVQFKLVLDAQTTAPASKPASISVSLALEKDKFAIAEKPWAVLTVKNISNQEVALRTDMFDYRVRVEGENGEPPKTSYHRRIRGEGLPGESDLVGGGPVDEIPPGESKVYKFDLSYFYDLEVAGKYKVYIEVRDRSSDTWVRTNTVPFIMQAPAR